MPDPPSTPGSTLGILTLALRPAEDLGDLRRALRDCPMHRGDRLEPDRDYLLADGIVQLPDRVLATNGKQPVIE